MQSYETMVVYDSLIGEDGVNKEAGNFEDFIKSSGCTHESTERIGKRKLAYQIKKRSHGDYVLFYHKSKKDFIGEIEKQFKYNDKILRYLTVKSIEETEEVA